MADRKTVSEHYRGHDIDFDTGVDRFEIMQEGANPKASELDDDTKVKLGPKTQPHPNDPYCNC